MRRRVTPDVPSSIQVGEERVTVHRAKRKSKRRIEQIRRIDVQLRQALKKGVNMPVINDTHHDDGQEGKRGRPDARVYRKHGEALKNVYHACRPAFRCVFWVTWYMGIARLP